MGFDFKIKRGQKSKAGILFTKAGVDRESPKVQKGCINKRARFDNRKRAATAAAGMRRKTGLPFSFYHCPSCGKFHLTTTAKKVA